MYNNNKYLDASKENVTTYRVDICIVHLLLSGSFVSKQLSLYCSHGRFFLLFKCSFGGVSKALTDIISQVCRNEVFSITDCSLQVTSWISLLEAALSMGFVPKTSETASASFRMRL